MATGHCWLAGLAGLAGLTFQPLPLCQKANPSDKAKVVARRRINCFEQYLRSLVQEIPPPPFYFPHFFPLPFLFFFFFSVTEDRGLILLPSLPPPTNGGGRCRAIFIEFCRDSLLCTSFVGKDVSSSAVWERRMHGTACNREEGRRCNVATRQESGPFLRGIFPVAEYNSIVEIGSIEAFIS